MGNFVRDHKLYTSEGIVDGDITDPVVTKIIVGLFALIVIVITAAVILGGL